MYLISERNKIPSFWIRRGLKNGYTLLNMTEKEHKTGIDSFVFQRNVQKVMGIHTYKPTNGQTNTLLNNFVDLKFTTY